MINDPIDALKEIQNKLEHTSYDGFWYPDDVDKLNNDELKRLANDLAASLAEQERFIDTLNYIVDQVLFSEMLKG